MTLSPSQDASRESAARITGLSDAIFAFALTVLVLDVRLPDATRTAGVGSAAELMGQLLALWPRARTCLLSVLVLAMYWIAHHNTFLVVRRTDRVFAALNLLFLTCILFVPFSASVLGAHGGLRPAIVLYGLTLILTSLALSATVAYAMVGGRLVDARVTHALLRRSMWRLLLPVGVYGVSIDLAFARPSLSIVVYVLLPLAYLIPSDVDHWASGEPLDAASHEDTRR